MRSKQAGLIILAAGFLSLLLFQNCTAPLSLQDFSNGAVERAGSADSSSTTTAQTTGHASGGGTGNGAGYDGFVYVRLAQKGSCGADPIQAQLNLRASDNHLFLMKNDCQTLAQPLDVTASAVGVIPSPGADVKIYAGVVFTRATDPANVSTVNSAVVHCQNMTSSTRGIVIDVFATSQPSLYTANVYEWFPGGSPEYNPIAAGAQMAGSLASPVAGFSGANLVLSMQRDSTDTTGQRYIGNLVTMSGTESNLTCYLNP